MTKKVNAPRRLMSVRLRNPVPSHQKKRKIEVMSAEGEVRTPAGSELLASICRNEGPIVNTKKTLNVAMIGYGFMGRAHSNAFHQVGRFFDIPYEIRLKVMCGRQRSKTESMAMQWGWEEVQTDWHAVVALTDIDLVDICSPNHLHAPIAIAAAQAGKTVLCEKPWAMSLAEAEGMARATHRAPTLVWFNYRRIPAVVLAKRLVDEGRLGTVYHYRATYLQSWAADPALPDAWRFHRSEAGSGG